MGTPYALALGVGGDRIGGAAVLRELMRRGCESTGPAAGLRIAAARPAGHAGSPLLGVVLCPEVAAPEFRCSVASGSGQKRCRSKTRRPPTWLNIFSCSFPSSFVCA